MSKSRDAEGSLEPRDTTDWNEIQQAYQAHESEEVDAILARVHARLQGDVAAKASGPSIVAWLHSPWLWRTGLAGLCCVVGAGLWLLQQPGLQLQPSIRGGIQLSQQRSSSRWGGTRLWKLRTTKKSGRIAVPKRWSIKLAQHTSMAMTQIRKDEWEGSLTRGATTIYVVPRANRRFHISMHGARVLVKGTLFRLLMGSAWFRVEVMRGHVEVRVSPTRKYQLRAGQGIRVVVKGQGTRYALPQTKRWSERIRWTQRGAPNALKDLLSDLLESRQCSVQRCRVWLEQSIDRAKRQRNERLALQLLQILRTITKQKFSRHNVAFDIARSCWKAKHKLPRCLVHYQRSLQALRDGARYQRERVQFYLIHALIHARQWQRAAREMRALQRAFSTSFSKEKVQQMKVLMEKMKKE